MISDIIMAQVASVETDGVHLIIAGSSTATAKGYKRLASASVVTGDLVLACEISGTRVILGKIV